jgi:hypothetical protein
MDKYNPSLWRNENNSWITDTPWSGIGFEQGSFNEYVYPKYRNYIEVLSWKYFNNIDKNDPESYISHYLSHDRKVLIKDHY